MTIAQPIGAQILLLDGERDVGADARQRDLVWPTLIDSEATTKNQPPDIDIIMFQTSAGIANGTSSCQNLIQGESRNDCGRLGQFGRHGAQRSGRS